MLEFGINFDFDLIVRGFWRGINTAQFAWRACDAEWISVEVYISTEAAKMVGRTCHGIFVAGTVKDDMKL